MFESVPGEVHDDHIAGLVWGAGGGGGALSEARHLTPTASARKVGLEQFIKSQFDIGRRYKTLFLADISRTQPL